MKTLTIMTGQMNVGKKHKDIALDITVRSGDKAFSPSWDMVMGYKKGEITAEEYTEEYHWMMQQSVRANRNRERWIEVVNSGEVLLLCYCPAGAFCHRHLFAGYLKLFAESQGIEVIMKGELS